MEYIIQPLIGVNEFVFGGYRKDILAKTSLKIKTTREEKDGNNSFIIDDYGDFLPIIISTTNDYSSSPCSVTYSKTHF